MMRVHKMDHIALTGQVQFSVFAPCNAVQLAYAGEASAICSFWSSMGFGLPSSHALLFSLRDVSFFLSPRRHSSAREEIFLLLY